MGVDVDVAFEGGEAVGAAEFADGAVVVAVEPEESVGAGRNPHHAVAVEIDVDDVRQRVRRVVEVLEDEVRRGALCREEQADEYNQKLCESFHVGHGFPFRAGKSR